MTETADRSARHVSSYHLELVRLGEASADERTWIDGHLRTCGPCAEMAAAFHAHRHEFAASAAKRAPAPPAPRWTWARRWRTALLGTALLVPAAAGAVLVASARRQSAGPAVVEPEEGVKGGAGFYVVARRGNRVFPARPGEVLRPADQIRFVLERVRHPYVLIASVDGAGRATIYVPYQGQASFPISAQQRLEIPGSIIMDDSPGPERLFALFSSRPLQAAPVRAALAAIGARGADAIRRTSTLDVGAQEQVSIVVEKEVSP